MARMFHDLYERLAPSFGYETREDTKAFDPQSKNGRLMVEVCGQVAAALRKRVEEAEADNAKLHAEVERMRPVYDSSASGALDRLYSDQGSAAFTRDVSVELGAKNALMAIIDGWDCIQRGMRAREACGRCRHGGHCDDAIQESRIEVAERVVRMHRDEAR